MKKFFLYGSAVILLAIVVTGLLAPKHITVQRSVVVNQSVDDTFGYFLSLQNMEQYSPWQARDPKTIHQYRGTGNAVGSVHRWVSENKEVGVGEQEIKSISVNKEIVSELRFEKPFESTSEGFFKFKSLGNKTQVTWGYNGKFGFLESIFMLFLDMDKLLGADFEQGLNKAKSILEK